MKRVARRVRIGHQRITRAAFGTLLVLSAAWSAPALAGVSIAPFASIGSTKTVKRGQDKTKENEIVREKQAYGIMGSLKFMRLLGVQVGVGQYQTTTTMKVRNAVDDFDSVDYEKDLNMSTDDPEDEVKEVVVARQGRATVSIDPGFWIFVLRAKAGVTATQRILTLEQTGRDKETLEEPIKYNPTAGAGAGIRFGPKMYFIAEYNLLFYKFPEYEPFMRDVTVSFNVSI